MKTILFFHGLGSSAASIKFVRIQQMFGNKYHVICPEWTYTSCIRLMLANLLTQYENSKAIVIIGNGTGGNFAYQLTESMRDRGAKVKLILINPLLHIGQRTSQRSFPAKLANYLWEIKEVNNCTLILGAQVEAIDHGLISIGDGVQVFEIDDNHQIRNPKSLITILKSLLKKKRGKMKKCIKLVIKIQHN